MLDLTQRVPLYQVKAPTQVPPVVCISIYILNTPSIIYSGPSLSLHTYIVQVSSDV